MIISVDENQNLSKEVREVLALAIKNEWRIRLGFNYNPFQNGIVIEVLSKENINQLPLQVENKNTHQKKKNLKF